MRVSESCHYETVSDGVMPMDLALLQSKPNAGMARLSIPTPDFRWTVSLAPYLRTSTGEHKTPGSKDLVSRLP
jgi:hypothetical protein